MSILSSPEFSRQKQAKTTHMDAWKDGYYETYCVHVALPAVRLHAKLHRRLGRWFAVDTYAESVAQFRKKMALINPSEVAESFILPPETVFNIGTAKEQGRLPGGGFQIELVNGPPPIHNEHLPNVTGGSRVPL